jgi:hypothetical protein
MIHFYRIWRLLVYEGTLGQAVAYLVDTLDYKKEDRWYHFR